MNHDSSNPIDLLAELDPAARITDGLGPDALRVARERVLQLAATEPTATDASSARRPRRGIWLGAATVLVAASFAPPVQALAERLGELVGIGDEPTRSIDSGIAEPAVVIGDGQSPNGTAYEVVASADMNIYRDEHPATCISLDMPNTDGPTNAACLNGEVANSLDRLVARPAAYLGSTELGSDRLVVDGLASNDVASAEVERTLEDGSTERYPAEVSHLDGELAAQIGTTSSAAFVLAFLPSDLVPPPPTDLRDLRGEDIPVPAPAPGEIGQKDPGYPVGIADRATSASAAEAALGRLSLVAYDSTGQELARRTLDSAPFADVTLYAGAEARGSDDAQALLDECFREVLPNYGTPGEIKPQLPDTFGEDLNNCLQRLRGG
jgi:hypothetical protein